MNCEYSISDTNSSFCFIPPIICEFDKTLHPDLKSLHLHLRKFRVKQEDYYHQYYPRKDLLNGENIPFKSIDQYFAAHFVDKNNMKRWYKENPEEAKKLSIRILRERMERKNLKALPGEVELISAGMPSSQYYYCSIKDKVLEAGFLPPYDYNISAFVSSQENRPIVVDTREQTPLDFGEIKTISKSLSFGDYAIEGRENEIVIERKSLPDLIGSCVSHYERFRKEFERAKDVGAYLIVLCEENLNTAMNYNFIPYFKRYIKARPEGVFHNIRELIHDFDCQFVFVDGRERAANLVPKLLNAITDVKTLDLQWAISRAKLL